ncbi:MAG: imidazole glycerol phosphate synthase subunit HisH [Alphaproteobacteria bacterium]|nr:imidazole glycerol phosphate synthase subunit HisH [Alphaproteobacteria bacterium]
MKNKTTLAIVDSGVANLTSVMAAAKRLGSEAEITSDPAKIKAASKVILPGVGAAAAAMQQLKAKNLIETIRALTQPVLGICLGMQIMFERSEESGGCDCLGVIPGKIARLPDKKGMPIPHMGWNSISIRAKEHPLFKGVEDGSFVYFVHSYAAPVSENTLASCEYSAAFTAIAGYKNFIGCQFHPERSSQVGQQILQNFLDM